MSETAEPVEMDEAERERLALLAECDELTKRLDAIEARMRALGL